MVMLLAAVSCSCGCIDAQQLQIMACEHAPSGGVRHEDAVQSAGSSSHFSSESCLSLTCCFCWPWALCYASAKAWHDRFGR